MKNKLFQLMLASLLLAPNAPAATRADVDRLGREVILAEDAVTGLERDRDNFDRQHPDPAKLSAEEKSKYEAILRSIDQAVKTAAEKRKEWNAADLALLAAGGPGRDKRRPAAGTASEHINGTCPFVSDSISSAAGMMEGNLHWTDQGRVQLNPLSGATIATERSQSLDVKGAGLPFGRLQKKQTVRIKLDFAENGRVEQLRIDQANTAGRWSQTMEYEWHGNQCDVKRVRVTSPDLPNIEGVSFDADICRAFESKGLLDEKKIDECIDYNDRLGNEIEKATKAYGDRKTFALFTTEPNGKTILKRWKKKDHLSVNAAIARDCAFHLKKNAGRGDGAEDKPSGNSPHNGTSAR